MNPPYALHRAVLNALTGELARENKLDKAVPRINLDGDIELTWHGNNYIIRAIPKRQIVWRAFV